MVTVKELAIQLVEAKRGIMPQAMDMFNRCRRAHLLRSEDGSYTGSAIFTTFYVGSGSLTLLGKHYRGGPSYSGCSTYDEVLFNVPFWAFSSPDEWIIAERHRRILEQRGRAAEKRQQRERKEQAERKEFERLKVKFEGKQ
jgi:hypothetical protein